MVRNINLLESRRRILLNTPHIKTLTGMNMTFNTDMERELKKCIINFSPIQLGTGDPSPENVRNIYGRSEIGIGLSNENLLPKDPPTEKIYTADCDGTKIKTASNAKICAIIPMPYNATVHSQKIGSTGASLGLVNNTVIKYGDPCYSYTGFTNAVNNNKRQPDVREYYFILRAANLNAFNGLFITDNFMISYGSSRKTYIPPMGTILNIDFPEEIYGGYVDLLNGELVKTWDTKLGSELNWSIVDSVETMDIFRATNMTGKKYDYGLNNLCDSYEVISANISTTVMDDKTCKGNHSASRYSKYYYVRDSNYANNLEGFIEHIADVRFVYELATPVHYSIEPQILKTLRGLNNIWSNANGNIEVSFYTH